MTNVNFLNYKTQKSSFFGMLKIRNDFCDSWKDSQRWKPWRLEVAEAECEECKKKWLIAFQICSIILILLMIGTFYLVAYPIIKDINVFDNVLHNYLTPNGSIITFYALDLLDRTFCFSDGKYGHTFSDGSVNNKRSDIITEILVRTQRIDIHKVCFISFGPLFVFSSFFHITQ